MSIGAAIVGTSRAARELAPILLQNPSFRLRAVWSQSQAGAEEFNLEVAGCSLEAFFGEPGLEALLSRPEIEAFVVEQLPEVRQVLASGRHVLSAGPVAPDREQAELLLKDNGISGVWFVADHLRYEPVFQPSSPSIAELGPLVAAEIYAVFCIDAPSGCSDESMWIQGGVQQIAMLRQLLGQVVEVNCVRTSNQSSAVANSPESFFQDALSGTLRFDSGAAAVVNWHSCRSPQDERLRVTLWGGGSLTVQMEPGRFTRQNRTKRESVPAAGAELQVEAWAAAILELRGSSGSGSRPPRREALPITAIVDLMVVSAMLQSRGIAVQIREKPRPRR